ncbi:MAG: polysaccharide deacetylase family protein [Calditrichota bacterium]
MTFRRHALLFSLLIALFLSISGVAAEPVRTVAVTIDDLPAQRGDLPAMQEITNGLIAHIQEHEIPAVGFVIGEKVDVKSEHEARLKLLRQWQAAGLELGNHTYSHVDPNRTKLADYEQDVRDGEAVFAELGITPRYFRHPYLRTGPTVEYRDSLNAFLKAAGYTIAPVTHDNDEYLFGYAYDVARSRGDRALMDSIAVAYLDYMNRGFAFYEELSNQVLGYEVPQILLLHANRMNADYLGELAERMKTRGYRFVTLETALADRAYLQPERASKRGLSWLYRWMDGDEADFPQCPEAPEFVK